MVLFQIGGLIKASPRSFLSRELAKVKNQSMKVTGGNSYFLQAEGTACVKTLRHPQLPSSSTRFSGWSKLGRGTELETGLERSAGARLWRSSKTVVGGRLYVKHTGGLWAKKQDSLMDTLSTLLWLLWSHQSPPPSLFSLKYLQCHKAVHPRGFCVALFKNQMAEWKTEWRNTWMNGSSYINFGFLRQTILCYAILIKIFSHQMHLQLL